MKIIEQFIAGKRGSSYCEDGFIATDHFVAVIDGSTSKSQLPALPDGKSRGQVAMESVRSLLKEVKSTISMAEFCHQATEKLAAAYSLYYKVDILPHMRIHPEDRFCCSAIVYSSYWNEIWMIGDCQALVLNPGEKDAVHLTNDKPYEAQLAQKRSEVLIAALEQGADRNELLQNDPGRKAILPLLVQSMKGQNSEYPVIDGFTIPLEKVLKYDGFTHGSQLVLASDGYPRLFPTLSETEAYLSKYLKQDPLCIGLHKATKGWRPGTDSFDDRTYIRIQL